MGLRSFLLGAEQFGSGVTDFRKAKEEEKKANAAAQLRSEIESQYGTQFADVFGNAQEAGVNPVVSEGAKVLFQDLLKSKGGKDSPLSRDALMLAAPGASESEIDTLTSLSGKKEQDTALKGLMEKYKQGKVDVRQGNQLGFQREKTKIANYKDFNRSLQDAEVKFDDATKGLKTSLYQFQANPNKSSLQQLAVSMARAGGDTGVLSNQDLSAYKLSTIAQDFESLQAYLKDTPEDAITPSVKEQLVKMAQFGLQQSENRKKGRLKSLYENNASVFGENFLKQQKPDVMKTWEKRLGVEARKTDGGVEVIKKGQAFKGRAAEVMSAAAATKNTAMIQSIQNLLSKLPEGQDIGESAYSKIMQKISGGK